MQIKKFEGQKVNSFSDMGTLVSSPREIDISDLLLKKVQKSAPLEILVFVKEHANCDSLPLRYGMHFETDSPIILRKISLPYSHQTKSDRIRVDAYFTDSNNNEQFGHFVIGLRRGVDKPVLITVWRHDAKTEEHLSEVMAGLRKRGYLSSLVLLDLHQDYVDGKIATHEDLVILLAKTMSAEKVKMMDEIVTSSVDKANKAFAERDAAIALASKERQDKEEVAKYLVKEKEEKKELEIVLAEEKDEKNFYKAEAERYKREIQAAQRESKRATLSAPDILVDVLEKQIYRGSSCTILIMGDESRRHMKTSTFDPTGSVTAHAKTLKGKRVRISCWDPINQPGRWSNEGYFRNVYATE